jgi:hypothetical protein
MSAPWSFYQTLFQRCAALLAPTVRRATIRRLTLLTSGIIAAQSTVLARVAAELDVLALTAARSPAHIERTLRRTLNDPHLHPATCYTPLLRALLDWSALLAGRREVVLAVDDSTKTDQIHLLRLSLSYWGGSLPLAWAVWPQNVAQPEGFYWTQMDQIFGQVAALLPPGLPVIVVADRAFAVPNFLDRCTAQGWHFVVRVATTGSHRYRDAAGQEQELRAAVAQHLGAPGTHWQATGWLFKDAGWRAVQLAGMWRAGEQECLLVLSDLPLRRDGLGEYARRFWIEPGFRNDKSAGWQWERSQVVGVAHHARLLVAMALASLVVLSVGVAAARAQLDAEAQRRQAGCRSKPQPARWSVFTQGMRGVRRWLYGTTAAVVPWGLPALDAPSWQQQWQACQTGAPGSARHCRTG